MESAFASSLAQLMGSRPAHHVAEMDPAYGIWCLACGVWARVVGFAYCTTCAANHHYASHRSTWRNP